MKKLLTSIGFYCLVIGFFGFFALVFLGVIAIRSDQAAKYFNVVLAIGLILGVVAAMSCICSKCNIFQELKNPVKDPGENKEQ